MNVEEQTLFFREIILSLYDYATKDKDPSLIYDLPKELNIQSNCFYDRGSLERILPSTDFKARLRGSFGNMFMPLRMVTHGSALLPILTLNFNFGCSIPEIRLRIGLFLRHTDGEIKAIGYRLESPEGQDNTGIGVHHYYHVQMIRGIGSSNFPPSQFTEWVPDAEPSFPLDAEEPVELLLCLVLGLYGRNELKNFISLLGNSQLRVKVFDKIKSLKMGKFYDEEVPKWYWKATSKTTNHFVCYETHCKETEFLEYAKPRHQGHDFIEITPEEYDRLPSGDRKLTYKPEI